MQCSEPGAIRDEELLAYLAGEYVRPDVVQHLARCQSCTAQLADYRVMEYKLISKLYRWDCPSNDVLGEYQLNLLNQEQAGAVKKHLEQCVLCNAELATLTEFLANDPLLVERAPATPVQAAAPVIATNNHHVGQDAQQLLDQLRGRAEAGVRRIIASLLPPQPRLAYGVRGAESTVPGAVWPRLYAAEGLTISLQIERGSGRQDELQLIGLVTRKGSALGSLEGTPVRLLVSTSVISTQQIDDLGNFVFAPITPATYGLELQLPDGIVVIDQLPIVAQE
ncbi:hypothetical protein KSF_069080 [Reticulibacter mediterranei]|uniref:Zinc-finger domain-containing protein n=1 Tax=Reticulibacter mediterranei TaxID=2778369 RepID=A0A8J3IQW9_9CHLR|nr:hypothetical protein [Reticulibacter mediterranei]GHO96860.1 hypothetical protein KSF_069080 [Reticulibacter mediterranei]